LRQAEAKFKLGNFGVTASLAGLCTAIL